MLLDSLLVHPDTHEPLRVDWEHRNIHGNLNGSYRSGFYENVPYVLPFSTSEIPTPDIHHRSGSTFNYPDHYEQDAETFDYFEAIPGKVDREERNRLNQMIINRIPEHANTILDVGCGNAWLAREKVDERTRVLSMDISSRNPIQALKRVPHFNHEALIADVFHLPLRMNSFDCVVASEIMEHVPDPRLFISKLLDVVRPGGKLIITTPYNEQIQYHLCIHCNRPTPAHAHLHSFHEKNVAALIPESVTESTLRAFSHKYLNKSRLYVMIQGFPFWLWKSIDRMANKAWRHPMRLMVEIVK